MTQIAFTADPDVPVDELTMALWADALDQQSKEVCSVFGIPYVPVVYYKTTEKLPIDGTMRIARIMMKLDAPGALGFHDLLDTNVPYSDILWQDPDSTSVTASHENCEENRDPDCSQYAPWDDKDEQALELSDRVEGDEYTILATVGSVTRDIKVSNWLMPSAFDPNGKPPFDKMGRLTSWNGMTSGGYVILRSKTTGEINDVFAQRRARPRVVPASPAAHAAIMRRVGRPDSRMMRRLAAGGAGEHARLAHMISSTEEMSRQVLNATSNTLKALQGEVQRLTDLNAKLIQRINSGQ